MIKNKGRNNGTLYSWEKGQSGNPNGRPRKVASTLKIKGYTNDEIYRTIYNLLALKRSELLEFMESSDVTVFEEGVFKMIKKLCKDGKSEILDYILKRVKVNDVTIGSIIDYDIKTECEMTASEKYQEIMNAQ
jgi:hypothetical protein